MSDPSPLSALLERAVGSPVGKTCCACGESLDGTWISFCGRWASMHYAKCERYEAAYQEDERKGRELMLQAIDRKRADIPEGWPDTIEEYFDGFPETESTEFGRRAAKSFVASCDGQQTPPDGFTLYGRAGCGKTTLMASVARSLVLRNVKVRWIHLPTWQREMMDAFDDNSHDMPFHERMAGKVIVIDDLGAETFSPWFVGIIAHIVQHCIEERKPLLITSQYEREAMRQHYQHAKTSRGQGCDEVVVDRLVSRLNEISGAIPFGDQVDHRQPQWSFLR